MRMEEPDLRHTFKATLAIAVCGLFIAGASPADAKGCLKGAAVGGVAGHMAGHGVLGAAGGCAIGHHEANKSETRDSRARDQQHNAPNYDRDRQQ